MSRSDSIKKRMDERRACLPRLAYPPALPILEMRAEIVAAFSCVDWVTVFEEPTVAECLRALKPHIHAKGTDYQVETVPERDVMIALGGETAIAGDAKTHATRDLIRTVLERFGADRPETQERATS